MALADTLGNVFGFTEHDTDLGTEVVAGLTTFLTMSYIVVVNPSILVGIEGEKPGIIVDGLSYPATVQAVAVAPSSRRSWRLSSWRCTPTARSPRRRAWV